MVINGPLLLGMKIFGLWEPPELLLEPDKLRDLRCFFLSRLLDLDLEFFFFRCCLELSLDLLLESDESDLLLDLLLDAFPS